MTMNEPQTNPGRVNAFAHAFATAFEQTRGKTAAEVLEDVRGIVVTVIGPGPRVDVRWDDHYPSAVRIEVEQTVKGVPFVVAHIVTDRDGMMYDGPYVAIRGEAERIARQLADHSRKVYLHVALMRIAVAGQHGLPSEYMDGREREAATAEARDPRPTRLIDGGRAGDSRLWLSGPGREALASGSLVGAEVAAKLARSHAYSRGIFGRP